MAESLALLADSLDMLADATVYGVSLLAVRRGARAKARAARWSGALQISLGVLILVETVRRLVYPPAPEAAYMVAVSLVALAANVLCLRIVSAHKEGGIHMKASVIFSQNDVIANLSVILGGAFVWLTSWHLADLFVGAGIALLVASGGFRILREARASLRESTGADSRASE
jgi:cation diffusion facilitator family transporter